MKRNKQMLFNMIFFLYKRKDENKRYILNQNKTGDGNGQNVI